MKKLRFCLAAVLLVVAGAGIFAGCGKVKYMVTIDYTKPEGVTEFTVKYDGEDVVTGAKLASGSEVIVAWALDEGHEEDYIITLWVNNAKVSNFASGGNVIINKSKSIKITSALTEDAQAAKDAADFVEEFEDVLVMEVETITLGDTARIFAARDAWAQLTPKALLALEAIDEVYGTLIGSLAAKAGELVEADIAARTINIGLTAELDLADYSKNLPGGRYGIDNFWDNTFKTTTEDTTIYKSGDDFNAHFTIPAADGETRAMHMTVFTITATEGGDASAAHLFLYDEGYPNNVVVVYDVLNNTTDVLAGTDYVGYWGPVTGRTAQTARDVDGFFASTVAGTYTITMSIVEFTTNIADGTSAHYATDLDVTFGATIASHTLIFVVA